MAPRKPDRAFVKSADTDVPAEKTREDIRALLRRHGASGFGVNEDYQTGRVELSFVLPGDGGGHVPIRIPIETTKVYAAMYEGKAPNQYTNDAAVRERRMAQAERTAWRQLHLIIDATLTAAALGMMRVSDVFMAHTMIVTEDGRTERMADYLDRVGNALAPGVRALLPTPKREDAR